MKGSRDSRSTDDLAVAFSTQRSTAPAIGKSTLVPQLPPAAGLVQRQTSQHAGAVSPSTTADLHGASRAHPATMQIGEPAASANASPLSLDGGNVSEREKRTNDISRVERIYDTAHETGTGALSTLVPAYLAARDQCDAAAVAELGGRILGAYSLVHGAKAALDKALHEIPHHSLPGGEAAEDFALATRHQAIEAKTRLLPPLVGVLDTVVARTLTPHVFRGTEVAGQAVSVTLDGSPMQRTAKLAGELQRTIGMLVVVEEIRDQLLGDKGSITQDRLRAARNKISPWASRPLDIAFLRVALGPIWGLLDVAVTPIETKPSDALAGATRQAQHTGWLGDVGRVDIDNVCMELRVGGRQSAEFVIRQLYTADPDTRARLLIQIKERGLLDALCSAVGWADIKDLHDSLGFGFSEIKTDLQRYFIGKRGYGPGVGHEWEHHDSSLHGLVARLGGPGAVLNFALDVGTFGFNSAYGKALDDRSEGRTSEGEASRAKLHAGGRTAVIAALSLLTGGLADKAVRGGAATVSTLRGVGAGAAGGSVGGVSALAASDLYGNHISGDQSGFSSPEEYVKAALLGGAIGGAVGGLTQGLSNRVAERYIPNKEPPPTPNPTRAPVATDAVPRAAEPAGQQRPAPPEAIPEAVPVEGQGNLRAAGTRDLGLRDHVVDALQSLENIKRNTVGEVNSQPNHNHYSAARREAAGQVVARRPDGRPFSHVRDLQQAYDGLDNVREALEREIARPPVTMTERGLETLIDKYSEVQRLLSRLGGFLGEIGHSRFPPYHDFPPGT